MTGTTLDVDGLFIRRGFSFYECADGSKIDMFSLLNGYKEPVAVLRDWNKLERFADLGFVMAPPMTENGLHQLQEAKAWDDPEAFAWFVGGWGSESELLIANALRKMRPLLRPVTETHAGHSYTHQSTLNMRFNGGGHFQDVVLSQNEDGTFSWGDFPWGGAVLVRFGDLILAGAVSGLHEIEDDTVARIILNEVGKRIVIGDGLLPPA